ncbi:MAG TPA: hypothetical protein VE967_04675 [Gemmatimonadaceae bacterium]|nr:hypothetical protein [Gemmatimonadaceae bacterium]
MREDEIRDALRGERADAFAPGFADRTLSRWHAARTAPLPLSAALTRPFRVLAPLAAAAAIVFAALSVRHRDAASGQTLSDALLGARRTSVQPSQQRAVTLDDIYGLGSLKPGAE